MKFQCDCTGTLYTGELCEIGVVEIPSIPKLVVDIESDEIFIYARPTGYIKVTLIAEPPLLEFIPPSIQIDASDIKSSFKMTASRSGTYALKFRIEDEVNQYKFQSLKDKQIYVFPKKISILADFNLDFLISDEGRKSCNSMDIGNGLELQSTCGIDEETFQTPGFTFIKSNNSLTLPLSIAGLDENVGKRFRESATIDPSGAVEKYIASKHSKSCSQNCHNNISNVVQIEYILKNQFFQKTFIDQIKKKLPKWFEIHSTGSGPDYNVNNLLTRLMSKESLYEEASKVCSTFNLKEFPMEFTNGESINVYYSTTPLLMKVLQTKLQIIDFSKVCFLSGLQSGDIHILSSLPMKFVESSSQHHVIETLQSSFMKITNDSNVRALIDVSMKMKTFDGTFEVKCLLSLNSSVKVTFFFISIIEQIITPK